MSRTRGYCFTLNNYTTSDVSRLSSVIDLPRPLVIYLVFGEETAPTTGTPHLQGFIYFKNAQDFNAVKKVLGPTAHIEVMKGTPEQASTYCKKDGKYYEFGVSPNQGKRSDLEEVYQQVRDGVDIDTIVMENPDAYNRAHRVLNRMEDIVMRKKRRTERTLGEWVYGGTGTGKSHYAFSHQDAYVYPYDNGWWDSYKQQDVVIFDEFRGQIPFNELLRIVDIHPNYSVRRRGREPMPFTSKKVIITSALPPWEVYKNLDQGDSLAQLYRRFTIRRLWFDEEDCVKSETLEFGRGPSITPRTSVSNFCEKIEE